MQAEALRALSQVMLDWGYFVYLAPPLWCARLGTKMVDYVFLHLSSIGVFRCNNICSHVVLSRKKKGINTLKDDQETHFRIDSRIENCRMK